MKHIKVCVVKAAPQFSSVMDSVSSLFYMNVKSMSDKTLLSNVYPQDTY